MIALLRSKGYRSDPVKAWKATLDSMHEDDDGGEGEGGGEEEVDEGSDFNYIMNMQLWSLTAEKRDEILNNRDKKVPHLLDGSHPSI